LRAPILSGIEDAARVVTAGRRPTPCGWRRSSGNMLVGDAVAVSLDIPTVKRA
jgi:hypothetical protein